MFNVLVNETFVLIKSVFLMISVFFNIKNAVIKLAMPIGGILVFVSIVIIALKMIVNSNNANKRSESIGALAWVCAGTMLLGLALIVSGIILSIATNGSGSLIGGN